MAGLARVWRRAVDLHDRLLSWVSGGLTPWEPEAGTPARRWVVLVLLVLLPVVKWVQLRSEELEPHDGRRQLVLIAVLLIVVAVVYGRSFWDAAVGRQLVHPRPDGSFFGDGRGFRFTLGLAAVAAAVASAPLIAAGKPKGLSAAVLGVAAGVLAVLVVIEVRRHQTWKATGGHRPDHAIVWAVGPAVALWCVVALYGLVMKDGPGATIGDSVNTALVIGFGEEYLFRGLLFALAIKAGLKRNGFPLLSLAFAAWHIPDEVMKGGIWVDNALRTFGAMFLVSHFVFFPLRQRCRSLAGPALLHAAFNVAGNLSR